MTHVDSSSKTQVQDIWFALQRDARMMLQKEPLLSSLCQRIILNADSLGDALVRLLSEKLGTPDLPQLQLHDLFAAAHKKSHDLALYASADLAAILKNDPAAHDTLTPFLFFKGFLALQSYRLAHQLWNDGRKPIALYLQSRISELFAVDIHPAAKIGTGIMMDHATGIVIGETSVVEDDVLLWHGVTLGGTGTHGGDRHPKIRKGVWLGAGATVLGPVEVGANARIAADSVVLENIPAGVTAVGVPARVVSKV